MTRRNYLAIVAILFVAGCTYGSRERADQSVRELTCHPYDQQPPPASPPATPAAVAPLPTARVPRDGDSAFSGRGTDVRTVAYLDTGQAPNQPTPNKPAAGEKRLDLNIPPEIPGSEARRIELSKEPAAKQREIERLYPALPPLVAEPTPQPGPNGRPFTLADLQRIAAVNSPQLEQAAANVETARGNMLQANAYPNPTVSYQFTPSNNGSTPGGDGVGIDQTIKTGGKLALQTAAAEMALHNAELALRRARSDLSTQVRNAYFAVLVGKETVRVNRGPGPLYR